MKLLMATMLATTTVTASASDYWKEPAGVEAGQNIRTYNHSTGRTKDIDVDSVRTYGGTTTIETYNNNTNTYETIEVEATRKPSRFEFELEKFD